MLSPARAGQSIKAAGSLPLPLPRRKGSQPALPMGAQTQTQTPSSSPPSAATATPWGYPAAAAAAEAPLSQEQEQEQDQDRGRDRELQDMPVSPQTRARLTLERAISRASDSMAELPLPAQQVHARYSTAMHATVQHSNARYGTARYGTARHSTARHPLPNPLPPVVPSSWCRALCVEHSACARRVCRPFSEGGCIHMWCAYRMYCTVAHRRRGRRLGGQPTREGGQGDGGGGADTGGHWKHSHQPGSPLVCADIYGHGGGGGGCRQR
jgi:hypothetical protein